MESSIQLQQWIIQLNPLIDQHKKIYSQKFSLNSLDFYKVLFVSKFDCLCEFGLFNARQNLYSKERKNPKPAMALASGRCTYWCIISPHAFTKCSFSYVNSLPFSFFLSFFLSCLGFNLLLYIPSQGLCCRDGNIPFPSSSHE